MWAKMKYLSVVVAFLVLSFCQTAFAELAGVGDIDATHHFPEWYQDGNGLALELCLPPGGNCLSDPVIPGNTFSSTIGFGEKAYYWSASAQLTGTGAQGNLEMALVASFSGIPGGPTTGGIPADGEQIVFFQLSLGPLTGLTAGRIYRVVHPYGVIENLVADSSGTVPRQAQDIGCATSSATVPCDFTSVLGSPPGPFLQWDTGAPSGFVGNPATAHAVVGSPFATNIFRVEGPNAGGTGISNKQTNLFKVQGKIFAGATPIPLSINRATYTRPLPPQIEVLASSLPGRILNVSGTGIITTPMTPDGSGNYFARIFNPVVFPASITVTVSGTTTSVTADLSDIVTITLAEFNPITSTLTVQASSSDSALPLPTLTALGFGDLIAGSLVALGVAIPPVQVTVVSSAGGSATAPVSVIARPLARNDTALTLRSSAVDINVVGNDQEFGSGNSIDSTTVVVTSPPSKGTAVPTGTGEVTYDPTGASFSLPIEKVTFRYSVKDIFTQESNVATVTVTVAEDEVLTVTKAQFTTRTKWWQITGKDKTSAATTGKAILGNKITLYLGPDTTGPVIGEATVNAFGSWTISRINSPVDPGAATQVTAESDLGDVVTFSPITIR
jgi:hypothetical protein